MKTNHRMTIAAIALMLIAMLLLTACGTAEQAQTTVPEAQDTPVETAVNAEPETDEIAFNSGSDTQPNAELPAETEQPREPEQALETEQPADDTATPAPTEAPAAVDPVMPAEVPADGTYSVRIYRDQTVDSNGTVWFKIGMMRFVELPDATVAALKEGDTVQLPSYSFVIVSMSRGANEITFNEGTERCFHVEETNAWRFVWPSDVPYTYEAEQYTLPIAVDAVLTDENTPQNEGQNVYGVPYDGKDKTIGALDLLEDYFKHYYGLESELATVVIRNGEIAEVTIEYRP